MSENRVKTTQKHAWTASRVKNKAIDIVIYVFITLVSLTCLLPFIHVVSKSISEERFVVTKQVFLIPKGLTFDAYLKVFADASIMQSLYVTVIMTVLFTVLGMFLTICAAYPLSRKNLKGRKVINFIFIFTMYFAGGMIPDYLLMNSLGMLEKMTSLVLPLAFSAYNLVIMKNSLESSIPDSLVESALIDGASHYTILRRLVLPLSKPIIATLSLFYAVGRWNTYSDAMFYIKQNKALRPLQLKLYYLIISATESFQGSINDTGMTRYTDPEILKAACIVFATLPIIVVYPFLQKYFVQGTMIGAVKG
ncbi:carbohydrate ABC transporter permease [Lachnotalea sp. AF33-28]|jgi:putative aldouronate transport system permease protein|uniref:carbohydrate ABC transporter permease n=1 Tax=Lachnotalea sp. AF33-28 TaxID=2292046 RepID=UPI000E4BE27D|nr:carbohydrate ABC transporter permease [Lachnotalea sp. AF33-28]RHP35725.1 carbohydrate ABC transporter permease [Lachnotalea sp. AF33-28]